MSSDQLSPRERLLAAALRMLESGGPESLQARKLAAEIGASTMAVYTHFGGMPELLDALVREGFERFNERLDRLPETEDPVTDLLAQGLAYREFALANPQMYRLMFGLTTRGIGGRVRDLTEEGMPTTMAEGQTAFGYLVDVVTRVVHAGRVRQDEPAVIASQMWSTLHGYVLLEMSGVFGHSDHGLARVLWPLTVNLLVGLGADRAAVERSALGVAEASGASARSGQEI